MKKMNLIGLIFMLAVLSMYACSPNHPVDTSGQDTIHELLERLPGAHEDDYLADKKSDAKKMYSELDIAKLLRVAEEESIDWRQRYYGTSAPPVYYQSTEWDILNADEARHLDYSCFSTYFDEAIGAKICETAVLKFIIDETGRKISEGYFEIYFDEKLGLCVGEMPIEKSIIDARTGEVFASGYIDYRWVGDTLYGKKHSEEEVPVLKKR